MEPEYVVKIIILGAPVSGKKSFIRRVSQWEGTRLLKCKPHSSTPIKKKEHMLTHVPGIQYCEDVFTDLYEPVEETYEDSRLASIAGIRTLINLERIPSTLLNSAPESCRSAAEADALILLYEGSSPESLEELRRMRLQMLVPYLEEVAPPSAVIAGKADGAEAAGQAWERGLEEGSNLAVSLDAKFGVASALWGDGVKDVVEELAARVLENKGVDKEVLMGAGS